MTQPAEEKKQQPVVISAERLRAFGQWLVTEHANIDLLTGMLKRIKLSPGAIPGGKELRERFDARRNSLDEVLTVLSRKILGIGYELIRIANIYANTEQENLQVADMDRLGGLIDFIGSSWDLPDPQQQQPDQPPPPPQ